MAARTIRVVRPTDPVKVTFGAGDEYRYLATGDDTDGGCYLVEATVPPGGGPPFHIQTGKRRPSTSSRESFPSTATKAKLLPVKAPI